MIIKLKDYFSCLEDSSLSKPESLPPALKLKIVSETQPPSSRLSNFLLGLLNFPSNSSTESLLSPASSVWPYSLSCSPLSAKEYDNQVDAFQGMVSCLNSDLESLTPHDDAPPVMPRLGKDVSALSSIRSTETKFF